MIFDEELGDFIDFVGTPISKVYYYLMACVVRSVEEATNTEDWDCEQLECAILKYHLYNDFYKNNLLAASCEIHDIAKYTKLDTDLIFECLDELELCGIIEHHECELFNKDSSLDRVVNVFILGFIKDNDEYLLINNKYSDEVTKTLNGNKITTYTTPKFFGGAIKHHV